MGVYMGLQAAITLNRAYDEGGMKGLATSAGSLGISAYVQTVSAGMMDVNFSYTRDGGFGGGLSFGNNTTFHAGVGYTTKSKDWNANAGYGKTTVGVSKTKQGGWGGSFQAGAYEVSYSEKNGFGAAISVPMGKDGKYGSMRFGMQFDDHMGWKGADVSYTTKETAGKQFGGTQTFGFGYNEDSGYRLTASTNVKTAGGLRANTTNSFSFDKDGTFSGAAIDASMRFTYVNYQDMRERSKRTDEEMTAAEREAAERAREEMGWFDRAADMLSGAWLSMNGTLGQWEKDITKMISDFGESLGNWFTGDGFYTNNEMAVNAAMKELGRQEAVAAALGAYEEFSKNYDVAVKAASEEYNNIFSEAMKGYDGYNQAVKIATDRILNGYTMNVDQLKADALALNQGGDNGLVSELNNAIKNIKNNKGLDANSIKDSVCVPASMYIMLKNSGANVGSFSEFYADNVNNGLIRGSDAFVDQDNQAKIVSQYKIDGSEIELVRTKDYSEYLNNPQGLGIVRYSVGNGGHNMNVYNQNGASYMADTGWSSNTGKKAEMVVKPKNFMYYMYLRNR
jgi:hypothetical protein